MGACTSRRHRAAALDQGHGHAHDRESRGGSWRSRRGGRRSSPARPAPRPPPPRRRGSAGRDGPATARTMRSAGEVDRAHVVAGGLGHDAGGADAVGRARRSRRHLGPAARPPRRPCPVGLAVGFRQWLTPAPGGASSSRAGVPAASSWRRHVVTDLDQGPAGGVGDHRARLGADQQPAQVVPRGVGGVPVDQALDGARRPRRTGVSATDPRERNCFQRSQRAGGPDRATRAASTRSVLAGDDRGAVAAAPSPRTAVKRHTRWPGSRPGRPAVRRRRRHTASGPVGDAPGAVGGPVDRVEDYGQSGAGRPAPARLLGEHGQPAPGPARRRAAASATRSMAYWPGRSVRARRSAPTTGFTARATASAAWSNASSRVAGSMPINLRDDHAGTWQEPALRRRHIRPIRTLPF